MTLRALFFSLLISGSAFCMAQTEQAWVVDMTGASTEDAASLRTITYEYNAENKVFTFHNLIEQGADVQFHDVNPNSNVGNIRFDNGAETDESPFTWLLPNASGENAHLIAVLTHFDYSSPLHIFNTGFSASEKEGHIVILDGNRNKVKRVIAFGAGTHGEEQIEEVADIAAFKAKAKRSKSQIAEPENRASVYKISGAVTCIADYQIDNSWFWVQDATGTLGIYVNHSFPLGETHSYKAGDVLQGITGFSVGSESDGYQMEVDDERFYVYDTENHDSEKEYTLFPTPLGRTEVLPPSEITSVSQIAKTDNHNYVVLKGFTYEQEVSETDNAYPARLKDANGGCLDLSWDLVYYKSESSDESRNCFLENVEDGTTGDFEGFISNFTKNITILHWTVNGMGIEELTTTKCSRKIVYKEGKLLICNGGINYNLLGEKE